MILSKKLMACYPTPFRRVLLIQSLAAVIGLLSLLLTGINVISHFFGQTVTWAASIGLDNFACLLLASLTVLSAITAIRNMGETLVINEKLQQGGQFFQRYFEQAADGMAICQLDGQLLQVNQAFCNIVGNGEKELVGQPIVGVFAPQYREGLAGHIHTAHQQGHCYFESVHIHKDGHLFPVEIDITAVGDTAGSGNALIINVKDISKQKNTERALKQSEKLFHSIVEYVPVMIFLKNADNLCMELINRKAEEIMGYSRQEMLGKNNHDLFPKEEADFFGEKDRQTLASRQVLYIAEEPLRKKNGETCILQTLKIGLYDDDGKATHLLGVSLDITERKRTESALQISEARLNRAQSVAQIGSWALDIRTNILVWTAETYRIFGIPNGTPLTYEMFLSFVHPDDRNYVDKMWQCALLGEPYDIEHRLLVDGEVRWLREKADLEFDGDGQLIGGIGITQDITERKRSESALRESEEKLRGLFELSPLGIALTDMQGRYIEFNPAFRHITGYTQEELAQLDYWQLTPKQYAEEEAQQLDSLNATGRYGPYEKEYIHKNGQLIPLCLNGLLLEGRNGKKYIWSIVEDISVRRNTEQELHAKRAEQRKLLEIQASILDALPANIALIDQQGIIQQTNRSWLAFAEKYGASPAKVGVGCDYLAVCDHAANGGDKDTGCVADEIRRILAGENAHFSCEYPCHQPDRKQWFLLQVVPIPVNNRLGAVVMHLDITESYLAKEQLHGREEEFRALVENSPDIIIRFDSKCRYLYVNPAVEAAMGIPARNYISKTLGSFGLSDPGLTNADQTIKSVFENGEGRSTEFSFKIAKTMRHFHARFVPEYNQQSAVASVLVVMRDITDSKNFEIALSQSRQQLRGMAAQTEIAREQERKSIAREVHDELGQNLTALRMEVSLLRIQFGVDNPALLEKLKPILGLVDHAIKNVRNVTTNLRPAALDMGLMDSLKWLCAEFTEHSGIPCKLHHTKKSHPVDESRSVQIFRILQESLTNITRHAKASHVYVTLQYHDNQLWLDVHDNGVGFDSTNQPNKSFGLLGIRERAIVLGGYVDIVSALGKGTTVSLRIPTE